MYLALGIAEAKEEVVHTTGAFDLGRELLVGIHRTCAANLGCTNNRTVLGVKTQGYVTVQEPVVAAQMLNCFAPAPKSTPRRRIYSPLSRS